MASTAAGGPIAGGTWRDAFFTLWAGRERWRAPAVDEAELVRDRFRRLFSEGGEASLEDDDGDGEENRGTGGETDLYEGRFEEAAAPAVVRIDDDDSGEASGNVTAAPVAAAVVAAAEVERGSIKVCVRMRPRGVNAPRAGAAHDAHGPAGVVLPLHQRLQIIKV